MITQAQKQLLMAQQWIRKWDGGPREAANGPWDMGGVCVSHNEFLGPHVLSVAAV